MTDHETFAGHGWSSARLPGKALHVGGLPGRKSICLYEVDGSVIRTLAFFKTAEQAEKVMAYIDALTGLASGEPVKGYGRAR